MAGSGTGEAPGGRRDTRRTALGFGLLLAATAAIVVAVTIFFAGVDDESQSENAFPAYWNELEEGELSRDQLVDRLGLPTDNENDCLLYDDLIESEVYRFCFDERGVLAQKTAL